MKEILLTLAGAALVTVLCDALISGSSMKKYTRLFIGITVSTILAIPIVNFLSVEEISVPTFDYTEGYIEIIDSQYAAILNQSAEVALLEKGITASVEITWEEGEISEVIVVSESATTKEIADEIGYATMEILSIPLWKIKIRTS